VDNVKRCAYQFLILPLLLLLVVLPACGTATDLFDPPDFIPTKAPEDWDTIPPSVPYTKIAPVNKSAVPATRLAQPGLPIGSLISPLSDGGCLAVSTLPADPKDTSGNPSRYLRAIRFKADGTVQWDRSYQDAPFQGYALTMCIFPDDGFAVALQATRAGSTNYDAIAILRRFSPDGAQLWQTDEGQIDAGALETIIALPDGALLAAGSLMPKLADGSYGPNDVSLLRIESDGRIAKTLAIDSGGFDSFMSAGYLAGTGLILSWRSEDYTAVITQGGSFPQRSHITGYDESLSQLWQTDLPDTALLYHIQVLQDGSGFFAFGTSYASGKVTGTSPEALSSLFFFDKKGVLQWNHAMQKTGEWVQAAARLSDGRTLEGGTRQHDSEALTAFLTLLTPAGKVDSELDALPGTMDWIAATKDGGVTVCTRQIVRALPQPPYISSMWSDSEATVSHYDKALRLVWRRTIDQYKHDTRKDEIIPAFDGRLLVG
jgi:hypothetical protein